MLISENYNRVINTIGALLVEFSFFATNFNLQQQMSSNQTNSIYNGNRNDIMIVKLIIRYNWGKLKEAASALNHYHVNTFAYLFHIAKNS